MDKVTAIAASHLLAVSESERSFLESNKIVRKGDIKVLGSGSICGVNLERFNFSQDRRDQVRTSLSIPDDSQVLLFAGRLTEDKGLFDLTEAFISTAKTRPNLFWLVVGPDEEKIWPNIVNKLGDFAKRCKYVGFTVNMEKYMAASDFICLPSIREGFGMVIIEAAATGIPAIGYDIYGVSNAIDNGVSGLLVEKNNIQYKVHMIQAGFQNGKVLIETGEGEITTDYYAAVFQTVRIISRKQMRAILSEKSQDLR